MAGEEDPEATADPVPSNGTPEGAPNGVAHVGVGAGRVEHHAAPQPT